MFWHVKSIFDRWSKIHFAFTHKLELFTGTQSHFFSLSCFCSQKVTSFWEVCFQWFSIHWKVALCYGCIKSEPNKHIDFNPTIAGSRRREMRSLPAQQQQLFLTGFARDLGAICSAPTITRCDFGRPPCPPCILTKHGPKCHLLNWATHSVLGVLFTMYFACFHRSFWRKIDVCWHFIPLLAGWLNWFYAVAKRKQNKTARITTGTMDPRDWPDRPGCYWCWRDM